MGGNILVVDDEKSIRKTTSEFLHAEGYNIKTAETTEVAWETLQDWDTDLILLDIMLPGDLEAFVKRLERFENVKVLYLTSFPHSEAKRLGFLELSEKILGYVEKPFSLSVLLKKVKNGMS